MSHYEYFTAFLFLSWKYNANVTQIIIRCMLLLFFSKSLLTAVFIEIEFLASLVGLVCYTKVIHLGWKSHLWVVHQKYVNVFKLIAYDCLEHLIFCWREYFLRRFRAHTCGDVRSKHSVFVLMTLICYKNWFIG